MSRYWELRGYLQHTSVEVPSPSQAPYISLRAEVSTGLYNEAITFLPRPFHNAVYPGYGLCKKGRFCSDFGATDCECDSNRVVSALQPFLDSSYADSPICSFIAKMHIYPNRYRPARISVSILNLSRQRLSFLVPFITQLQKRSDFKQSEPTTLLDAVWLPWRDCARKPDQRLQCPDGHCT